MPVGLGPQWVHLEKLLPGYEMAESPNQLGLGNPQHLEYAVAVRNEVSRCVYHSEYH